VVKKTRHKQKRETAPTLKSQKKKGGGGSKERYGGWKKPKKKIGKDPNDKIKKEQGGTDPHLKF